MNGINKMWLQSRSQQVSILINKLAKRFSITVLLFFLFGCASPPEYRSNEIDLASIIELNLPTETVNINDLVDIEKLEEIEAVSFPFPETRTENDLDFIYVTDDGYGNEVILNISMLLFSNIESAQKRDLVACNPNPTSSFGKGEVSGVPYSYCIEQLQLSKSGPSPFPTYFGYYGVIGIQKGNLTITITEDIQTLEQINWSHLNDAIEVISESMKDIES